MNVAVITHYMPPHRGGIEQVADTLCAGYLSAGLDVRWIASRVPRSAPARDGHRRRVACWNGPERLFGVPVPIWSPGGWRELTALVRWADVLHVHDCLYPGSAVALMLARRHRTPVVLTQHVGFVRYALPPLNWLQRAAWATLGRAVLRGASRVIFATPGAARYVTQLLGGRLAGADGIPNGIDLVRFHPAAPHEQQAARARLGVPSGRPLVLFAGRLVEKKGLDLVLGVSERLPAVHVLIAGDGPLRTRLRAARENVSWLPAIPPHDMPACYHAADVLLLPSRDEGLPLVVQEALASGCPAVVSAEEAYAGELVRADVSVAALRSDRALAAEVQRLVQSGPRTMGRRARAYAEAHWDRRRMVERYLAVLDDVAAPASRVTSAAGR